MKALNDFYKCYDSKEYCAVLFSEMGGYWNVCKS